MPEHSALAQILGPSGIRAFFQPILDVSGEPSLHSLECLSKGPSETNMETPNVLFEYARLKRAEIAVDRSCVSTALRAAGELPPGVRLSVNVHASTLGRDPDFVDWFQQTVEACAVLPWQLAIEIVEHAPPWDTVSFLTTLDELRQLGVCIALDDVGLGQSNFKMILDVHPDFLKIDRYFVAGVHADPNRQAVIEAIQQLGSRFGAKIIAEGVENEDDLVALQRLGITLVQGYYLCEPRTASEITAMITEHTLTHS